MEFSFRLLSELYSHLYGKMNNNIERTEKFPSPIGVIFSLIILNLFYSLHHTSFRLLSELYSHLFKIRKYLQETVDESFRLLSELYSHLFN